MFGSVLLFLGLLVITAYDVNAQQVQTQANANLPADNSGSLVSAQEQLLTNINSITFKSSDVKGYYVSVSQQEIDGYKNGTETNVEICGNAAVQQMFQEATDYKDILQRLNKSGLSPTKLDQVKLSIVVQNSYK